LWLLFFGGFAQHAAIAALTTFITLRFPPAIWAAAILLQVLWWNNVRRATSKDVPKFWGGFFWVNGSGLGALGGYYLALWIEALSSTG